MLAAQLKNAGQMMTQARAIKNGIEFVFADGARGIVPFSEIPEIGALENLDGLEFPNAYELVLKSRTGAMTEIPWDFARHFCDPSYRPRVERVAARGRQVVGGRVRQLRQTAGLTQEELASRAGMGRVTLSRIENGEQSPRYETLVKMAAALEKDTHELLTSPDSMEGPS
jgi:DNA-binding XRE family transcriptional regulator